MAERDADDRAVSIDTATALGAIVLVVAVLAMVLWPREMVVMLKIAFFYLVSRG